MSTQGAGVAALPVAALVAALAAGAIVVAGTGVLIVNGVMWCGKQIDKNYQEAMRQWAAIQQGARDFQRSMVEDEIHIAQRRLARLAPSQARQLFDSEMVQAAPSPDTLAAASPDDAAATRRLLDDIDREIARNDLRAEIAAARAGLPPAAIANAEHALANGTIADLQAAIASIQRAWQANQDLAAQAAYQTMMARHRIDDLRVQIDAIAGLSSPSAMPSQVTAARQLVGEANAALDRGDLVAAGQYAEAARKSVDDLALAIATAQIAARQSTREALFQVQGELDTLKKLLLDARAVHLMSDAAIDSFTNDIALEEREAVKATHAGGNDQGRQIQALSARVSLVKSQIFAAVKERQQQQLAGIIAETLDGVGFHSAESAPASVTMHGDVAQIDASPDASHDPSRAGRVVTFTVNRNGEVTYDFKGYAGTTCEEDARLIFDALSKRGVILRDPVTNEVITAPAANKRQALLFERLKAVLAGMGFTSIVETFQDGMIELDAFNGTHGYRVVLPPSDGSFIEVFEVDGGTEHEISDDAHNALVAAIGQNTPATESRRPSANTVAQNRQRDQLAQ